MVGILLTVLAVLLVIVLAFCYSDQGKASRHGSGDFPYLGRTPKKKRS